eukprot:1928963-Rhodomonas_salina.1
MVEVSLWSSILPTLANVWARIGHSQVGSSVFACRAHKLSLLAVPLLPPVSGNLRYAGARARTSSVPSVHLCHARARARGPSIAPLCVLCVHALCSHSVLLAIPFRLSAQHVTRLSILAILVTVD